MILKHAGTCLFVHSIFKKKNDDITNHVSDMRFFISSKSKTEKNEKINYVLIIEYVFLNYFF